MRPPLRLPCLLALCLGLLASTSAPATAQDWPRFRGPNGSGIGVGLEIPNQWTDADYNWKIDLPGGGHSSPVVWGKRVFVTSADAKTGRRTLLCVNADDGKAMWRRDFDLPATNLNGLNSLASSTPAVDADRVYVLWSSPAQLLLVALDHEGKDAWEYDLGPFASQHGAGTSPVVVGDLVVVSDDQDGPRSYLLALDCRTGAVRWKVARISGSTVGSTPCLFGRPGVPSQIVFSARKHGLTGVDALSGKVLWSLPDLFTFRCVGSPVAGNDCVFATCGEGANGKLLVAVHPGVEGAEAKVAYTATKAVPYVPTPLVKGDLLFTWSDIGVVTCSNVAGGDTIWREKVGGDYYASPVCVSGPEGTADRLFCVSRKGEVVAVSASAKFALLGRTPLGELCHATPAIAGGRMFVRTFTKLMSVGRGK